MSHYAKVHLSFRDQVKLLNERGLQFADENRAARALQRHGYYRLAGYWVPFQHVGTQRFRPDVTFEQVLELYEYDKALRLLVLAALERIEIATRVRIAHFLGQLDPFALEQTKLLDRRFVTGGYSTWYLRYEDSIRRTTDRFILDFLGRYGTPLPIWLGIELWDFGMLSVFYSGMRFKHRDAIARELGLQDGRVMKSWLHSLTVTRNICAHHARFWNRNLPRPIALPDVDIAPALRHLERLSDIDSRRQYVALCCIAYLLDRIEADSDCKADLVAHLEAFPYLPYVSIADMGFPKRWRSEHAWQG